MKTKQLEEAVSYLLDEVKGAIDYLDGQSMLTPDEESLLARLQNAYDETKKLIS